MYDIGAPINPIFSGCGGIANIPSVHSVQVNIPAESGDMGILANHVPSIEQLRPGVIDIIEESGGSKQFFSMAYNVSIKELTFDTHPTSFRRICCRSARLSIKHQRC